MGEKKLGPPDAAVRQSLENISDLARLEEMLLRTVDVGSWQELLAPPPRRGGRRRTRE
jgi:hypothetical protein